MQTFIDTITKQVHHFNDDVVVTYAQGVYTFKTSQGTLLSSIPSTLQPYIPTLQETAKVSVDKLIFSEKSKRAMLLRTADIEINKLEDNGKDATSWRKYRQQLRDITTQSGFPENITWPVIPD